MDLYIERAGKEITLEEWKAYVKSDRELLLSEQGQGINPLTCAPMHFKIPGRAVYRESCEILYKEGKIGCDSSSDEIIKKLSEISRSLNACVFDCGEEIK